MFTPRRRRESLSPSQLLAAQITALFAAGEQGAWYDPSNLATLFQDAAGTTPVTAVGQPVGRMLDVSGRGNHATQSTAASRPLLQQDATGRYYLAFDGVDDALTTGAINFTATDKVTVGAGIRKNSDAAAGTVLELSNTATGNAGAFFLRAPQNASANYSFLSGGTVTAVPVSAASYPAPITNVLTGIGDIAGDIATLRVNGIVDGSVVTDQGTGNYGSYPLYIGARAGTSILFNGRMYGAIVRGAASSAAQIASVESFLNIKSGAF